jgi:hypothetical protein
VAILPDRPNHTFHGGFWLFGQVEPNATVG